MNKKQSKNSFGILGTLTIALVLLIAIAINLLFSLLPDSITKTDLSTEQLTRVSDEAKDYLKNTLDSEISIYLVAEAGSEDISLLEFLKRLSALDDRISFETADPTVKRAFLERITGESPDELESNTVIVTGKKHSSVKIIEPAGLYNYEVFVVDPDAEEYTSYGEYSFREFTSVYASLSEYFSSGYAYYEEKFDGETTLISAIDFVLTDPEKLPKVYFTSLHGEASISESLAEFLELSNLPSEALMLGDTVPKDAGIIVINNPAKDISTAEASLLESYLADGGKLFVITSHTNVSSLENLLSVLGKYGLSAQDDELYESNSYYHQPGYKNSLLPDTSTLAMLYGIDNYYFLASSSHIIKTSEAEGITHTELLKTSKGAYYEIKTEGSDKTEQSETAQFSVAVDALSITGGEIVWFACPYMLSEEDNTVSGSGNYVHFTAILSSLCDKNNVIFASKTLEQDILTLSAGQAGFWAVILIAVIPSAVLIVGAVRTLRRKRA